MSDLEISLTEELESDTALVNLVNPEKIKGAVLIRITEGEVGEITFSLVSYGINQDYQEIAGNLKAYLGKYIAETLL